MSYDAYLNKYYANHMRTYEARCSADKSKSIYEIFHDIPTDDLWGVLLTREYHSYPAIRSVLPDLPSADLQRKWCGNSGTELAKQSLQFYKKVIEAFVKANRQPLSSVKILDFGCGWGRLIRYFAKDVPEHRLCGCDPDGMMVDLCRQLHVPGTFMCSDYRPASLPFEDQFDLIYAYSVFTHLSEKTHWECLKAIHASLASDGVVILTVRPRSFIDIKGIELSRVSDQDSRDMARRFDEGQFIFHPYKLAPIEGEITYGEAIVPYSYIALNWSKLFHLVGPLAFPDDPQQIPVVLRKR